MEGWEKFKLKELLEIKYGKDHKKLKDGIYPLYGSGGIMRYVDAFLYDDESILIPRKGTLTNLFYLNIPFSTVDTMFWSKVNKEKVFPKFLYYLLKTYDLSLLDVGAAIPSLTTKVLKEVSVTIPKSKETQRKIASILSAYDDLIENNLKRIKLLEEQAQQTYEEWFVRFKFPGYEDVDIDEESGLPVGWEKKRFDKLVILQRGFDLPSRLRVEGNVPIFASTGITDYHNEFKVKGPGIITGRSGTLGQVQFTSEDFWPLNTALWVKKYFNCGPIYVLHFLRSLDLARFGGGSAVPSLDRKVVHSQIITIPDKVLINDFENGVSPIFKTIQNLQNQNQHLKEARDILLPRLMSGMIDVDSLEVDEGLGMVAEESEKYNKD
ncbi:type I restriction enzyme S subunit [Winogradskyella eximia]|uniref:Type I restriction enzyme S subunit n=2 Tax=Winogradskyella eximia TaxID=262006 RepID=A0A3D9H091_9FLAO|nr:type I restriction enzyme S subunit [Winogradskyella eximia]